MKITHNKKHDLDSTTDHTNVSGAASADAEFLALDSGAGSFKPTTVVSTDDHLVIGYTAGGPTIDLTVVSSICFSPTGIEFGNTDQEYDITGVTWITAVAGGALGGIPDEGTADHTLSDCLLAVATARDGSHLTVRENTGAASATNPLTTHFLFTSIEEFDTVEMRVVYNGSPSHTMAIEFWDYTTSAWSRITTFSDASDYVDHSIKIFGSSNFIGTGADLGDVKLQIIHISAGVNSHNIQFDYVKICDGGGGGGDTVQDLFKTFSADAGTTSADSPTDTLTVAGGGGIDTAIAGDVLTVSATDRGETYGEVIVTFDGGGSALTTGAKEVYVPIPYAGTITAVRLLANLSGSVVVDIWKDTYANFPPTVADTITAAAKPTITAAVKSEDETLTGWTVAITSGDILEFNIDSVATITKLILTLDITKTGA